MVLQGYSKSKLSSIYNLNVFKQTEFSRLRWSRSAVIGETAAKIWMLGYMKKKLASFNEDVFVPLKYALFQGRSQATFIEGFKIKGSVF